MKITYLLFLTLLSNIVVAQIKFGVKGGLNLADASQGITVSGKYTSENVTITTGETGGSTSSESSIENFKQTAYVTTSIKPSFYLGGFVTIPLNKKGNLSLKSELLYCHNGTKIDSKKEAQTNDEIIIDYASNGATISIGQINLPVLLKYISSKKVAFEGGLYTGIILFANSKQKNGTTIDEKSRLKTFDFGLNVGVSYPLSKNLDVAVRYNHGLINIDKTKLSDSFFNVQGLYFNRTFHIGLEFAL